MRITELKQVLSDIVQLTTEDGPVFFIRKFYLTSINDGDLFAGREFSDDKEEELIFAGLAFAAEKKACEYLARCEQCRFNLEKKLIQKQYDKKAIQQALDFLEEKNLLSDKRFCESWLRSHTISKPQGFTRLYSELLSRGIKSTTAKEALKNFFEENSEEDFCRKALRKAVKIGKSEEKLKKFLFDSGFSYKLINQVVGELSPDC